VLLLLLVLVAVVAACERSQHSPAAVLSTAPAHKHTSANQLAEARDHSWLHRSNNTRYVGRPGM
jgi:hypothetical protein